MKQCVPLLGQFTQSCRRCPDPSRCGHAAQNVMEMRWMNGELTRNGHEEVKTKRAALYVRTSSGEQNTGAQERRTTRICPVSRLNVAADVR